VYHVVQLLASHSTIRSADMIVVMQQGVVVEGGSQEQLLAKPTGMFAHPCHFRLSWLCQLLRLCQLLLCSAMAYCRVWSIMWCSCWQTHSTIRNADMTVVMQRGDPNRCACVCTPCALSALLALSAIAALSAFAV
jgi:ABC-type sulfate/molybdate transport systems ATPase subunit